MEAEGKPTLHHGALLVTLFALLLLESFYFYQYFLRVSTSGLDAALTKDYHLNAVVLSTVTSSFYYPYMVMQLAAGVLADRYGTRTTLSIACLVNGMGTLLFALSPAVWTLMAGRALIGASAAFAFIGVLKFCHGWFGNKQFAFLNAITLAVGTTGAVLGGDPLSDAVQSQSWHVVMAVSGGCIWVVGVLIWLFVHDPEETGHKANRGAFGQQLRENLGGMLRDRRMWVIAVYIALLYIPVGAYATLWCTPYFEALYPDDPNNAFVASAVFVGIAVGAPITSGIYHLFPNAVAILRWGAGLTVFAFTAQLVLPATWPAYVAIAIGFVMGACLSTSILAFVLVGEMVQPARSGVAFGFVNLAQIAGGAVMLPIIGAMLDQTAVNAGTYSVSNFRFSLAPISGVLVVSFVASLKIRRVEQIARA